ncbi:MAG: hypothetical protein KBD37_02815 [Burkholderiales bacterium]|nr:hypothetical protein [Burkholderiales bacterium]
MLKRAFESRPVNNRFADSALKLFSFSYHLYYQFVAKQYILQIDNFNYCPKQKDYIISLRFRNKGEILSIQASKVAKDKTVLKFISPIDSYIIGTLYGMYNHKLICNESQLMLEYFRHDNTPQVIEPLILISEHNLSGIAPEIILKLKYGDKVIKTNWREISKKPYLIQSLSANDAVTIGLISANCFMNELCNPT